MENLIDSRIAAAGFEMRHDKFIAVVRRLEEVYHLKVVKRTERTGGRPAEYYLLTEDVLKRLPTAMRLTSKMADYYNQLLAHFEKQSAVQALVSAPKSELLRMAANLSEQVEQQAAWIAENKPAADFGNLVKASGDEMKVEDAAKLFDLKPRAFADRLKAAEILKKYTTGYVPYQYVIDAGWMRLKFGTYNKPDGSEHAYKTAYITPKGLLAIGRRLGLAAKPVQMQIGGV